MLAHGPSYAGSDDELSSVVSAGVQGARCFVEGTIIEKIDGTWAGIEHLSKYDQLRGPESHSVVYVKSAERISPGPHEILEIH